MLRVPTLLMVVCCVLGLALVTHGQQQAYLKASDTAADDMFGWSIAASGDTVVVGALDSAGVDETIYVFVRNGAGWSQQAALTASNPGLSDSFGFSVAIAGDTLVVGAPTEDSAATGVNGDQDDNSAGNAGAAYVFVRDGTSWTQQAYLKASNTDLGDQFGGSVAIAGDTVVVGATREESGATGVDGDQGNTAGNAGAAYVFVRSGTSWSQQAYLKASNTDIDDTFARSVAIAGDTVVVGANKEDSNASAVDGDQGDNSATGAGAAYVFVRDGTSWSQQAYLKASNTDALDNFGRWVGVSGDTVAVGADFESSSATGVDGDGTDNGTPTSGAAYVFVRSGTSWSQQAYLKASNTGPVDSFGRAVAVAGDTVVVGALGESSSATGIDGDQDDDSAGGSGAAYVFTRSGTSWSQLAYLKASNTAFNDRFGQSVAVAGDTVVVGATGEDSSATDIDGDQADNGAEDAGAVYVFDLDQAECFLVIGDGPGNARFFAINHVFSTQVDLVEAAYETFLDNIPEFVLPVRRVRGPGSIDAMQAGDGPADTPPAWMFDRHFAVQVLMWNPEAFPQEPEQYTAGLYVWIQPNGAVHAISYGTDLGGMEIGHEIDTNAAGRRVIRFPFSIPGFEP